MFVYCNNSPIILTDPTGEFPSIIIAIIGIPTLVNRIVNDANHSNIDKEIEDSYSKEAAKTEIKEILSTYSEDSDIIFGDNSVKITYSYEVTSRYDRQKITEIINRTEVTDRHSDNMSAEWLGHNLCYRLYIKRSSTQDVDIDYGKDKHWFVNVAMKALEILGWD